MEEHIGSKWIADDLLPVNGTEEEVEALREAVLKSRAAAKAVRLEKKAAKSAKSALLLKADGSGAVCQTVVAESLKRSLEVRRDDGALYVSLCPTSQCAAACLFGFSRKYLQLAGRRHS